MMAVIAGWLLGWNFRDGHLHNEQLVDIVQARVILTGDLRCIFVEGQPLLGHIFHGACMMLQPDFSISVRRKSLTLSNDSLAVHHSAIRVKSRGPRSGIGAQISSRWHELIAKKSRFLATSGLVTGLDYVVTLIGQVRFPVVANLFSYTNHGLKLCPATIFCLRYGEKYS